MSLCVEVGTFHVVSGQHEAFYGRVPCCNLCGSAGLWSEGSSPPDDPTGLSWSSDKPASSQAEPGLTDEKMIETAIQALEALGLHSSLPAILGLLEHIAEQAGYLSAQHADASHATELMLIAARASELAETFRTKD